MTRVLNRATQRGMSLIELMVGVAIGLIVVAAASMAVTTQLSENRRLLVETQLQQDLRATSDIITRELRRAGALRDTRAIQGTWRPDMTPSSLFNDFADALDTSSANTVYYQYQPTTGTENVTGFFLDVGTDSIGSYAVIQQYLLGNGGAPTPQALTDRDTMVVTGFTVSDVSRPGTQMPCPKLCPPPTGGTACWPKVQVRELLVSITAKAKRYPEVERTMVSRVRLRNDLVKFQPPTAPLYDANQVCPQ